MQYINIYFQNVKIDAKTVIELKEDIKYLNFIKTQIMIYACREEIKEKIEEKCSPHTDN